MYMFTTIIHDLFKKHKDYFYKKLCYNISVMDPEKRAKRQSLKLIVSEAIMVIAVVAMVIVLAFLVSGYWLGSGFQVERQGMLQISSIPTGANVAVDGDAPWFQRTNTSKVLASGEHTVKLTKDGYDSWSRTVNIKDGLLYRVNYPRLFLLKREKESVLSVPATTTLATVSPDHKWLLLINNTTTWQLINLTNDKLEPKSISVATIFDSVSLADGAKTGLFTGTIASFNWSGDNEHILIKTRSDDAIEWVILNVKNPSESVNLTRRFATTFDDIRIFDNSATVLLALKGANLHKIDTSTSQISAVLINGVKNYNIYGPEIIFTALASDDYDIKDEIISRDGTDEVLDEPAPQYYTGIIKLSSPEQITYITSATDLSRAYISHFYDEKYITIIMDDTITIYKYDGSETIFDADLTLSPDQIKIGDDGSFVFMNTGEQVATFDMEASTLNDWSLNSEHFGWLDGHTIYTVDDGELDVYDYDGLNHRTISSNVSANFPVTITDNKWLYYFSDGELIREKILD